MTAPYYDDGQVTIWHGDCRDVTAWRSCDVLVTDPPYGVSYISNSSIVAPTDPIVGDANTALRDWVLAAWHGRPALVFGSWKVPRPDGTRHLLIWDKGDSPGMGDLGLPWGPGHEEVYVLGDGWHGRRRTNVLRFPTISAAAHARPDHPTPKPVEVMRHLIEYSPPGTVADPFAGSGSTLRAAKDLGRRAVGVEIEERYCEVAALRLGQEALPFGAPPAVVDVGPPPTLDI